MDDFDLPPWLQLIFTVLGVLAFVLPPFGRLLAAKWPDFGARVEALGVDLGVGLGRTPPAGLPRGVSTTAPLSERADNATTVVRAELKKAAKADGPPPLPLLLLLLALALVCCTRAQQIQGANAHRETGHTTAHLLGADAPKVRSLAALCDYEALEGKADEFERSIDLDNLGCRTALDAQTAFSEAHAAEVHAIKAAQKGDCLTTTPRNVPACDIEGMAQHTLEAGFALANATAVVVAAAKGATK